MSFGPESDASAVISCSSPRTVDASPAFQTGEVVIWFAKVFGWLRGGLADGVACSLAWKESLKVMGSREREVTSSEMATLVAGSRQLSTYVHKHVRRYLGIFELVWETY